MSPEQAPEAHDPPTKTKKRNPFEVFKKDILPEAPKPRSEVSPENRPTPQRRKRLAAEVFSALRKEQAQQAEQTPQSEQAPQPEVQARQKQPEDTAYQEVPLLRPTAIEVPLHGDVLLVPETLPFVARAKEMGRNVMRLIRRARTEVEVADRQEAVAIPTDIVPLAEADADVRAAMQELIAPIEAHHVVSAPEIVRPPAEASTAEIMPPQETLETPDIPVVEPAYEGSDGQPAPEIPVSPFVRAVEAVVSAASIAGHEAVSVKERLEKKVARLQKFGIIAVGTATAATATAGAAYVMRRLRKLKKEHRLMQRENKRFEAEVQQAQVKEERRLHKLEQTTPAQLDQPMRQQYVEQVSEFAHQQATEIRTVAHSRELLQNTVVASAAEKSKVVVEQSQSKPETSTLYNTQHREVALVAERPVPRTEHVETPKAQPERRAPVIDTSSPERLKQSPLQQIGAQAAHTVGAATSQLAQMVTGKLAAQTQPKEPITSVEPKKMSVVQGWPFMLAIAAGAVVFVLLIFGIV
jgi:hypothetical protein